MRRYKWVLLSFGLMFLLSAVCVTQAQVGPQFMAGDKAVKAGDTVFVRGDAKAICGTDWTEGMRPLIGRRCEVKDVNPKGQIAVYNKDKKTFWYLPAAAVLVVVTVNPPAKAKLGDKWKNPVDGAEMVYVPAGKFIMGPCEPGKAWNVSLDAYWIYKTEVTVAQYRRYCETVGMQMPDAPELGWKADHPIVNVSWEDARSYCDWAGVALPTEAQWEKAARGTDGRTYPWGYKFDRGKCLSSDGSERDTTAPVGSIPSGASPYGCLDMTANVWEWCADRYQKDYYAKAPPANPRGPGTGTTRVYRGGSCFYRNFINYFQCASRYTDDPTFRSIYRGFRCAKTE